MLLVVKHVKVVFILYNTCTCTHDIVQAAAWCTLTIVSTCLGSCETRPKVEKRASLLESAAPKREKLRQWITSCKPRTCSLVPGLLPRKTGRDLGTYTGLLALVVWLSDDNYSLISRLLPRFSREEPGYEAIIIVGSVLE